MQTCPRCGEWVPNTAAECTRCGEHFGGVQRVDDPRLTKVRTGIVLVYLGLVVVLLAAVGGLILVLVLRDPQDSRINVSVGAAAILASVLGIAGKHLCLRVPATVGAAWIVYASIAIDVVIVPWRLAAPFVEFPPAMRAVLGVAGVVAYVLFVVFLKRLAEYVGRPDLVKQAEHALSTGAFGVVLYLGGYLVGVLIDVGRTTGGLMIMFGAIVLLVAFVRYARVLHGLKAAI